MKQLLIMGEGKNMVVHISYEDHHIDLFYDVYAQSCKQLSINPIPPLPEGYNRLEINDNFFMPSYILTNSGAKLPISTVNINLSDVLATLNNYQMLAKIGSGLSGKEYYPFGIQPSKSVPADSANDGSCWKRCTIL